MADVASATGSEAPDGETANQRQARLRREKRQRKMAEQGEDRLARIKALNGMVAPADELLGGPTNRPPAAAAAAAAAAASPAHDPAEVDISRRNLFAATPTPREPPNSLPNPLPAAMLHMEQERPSPPADEDAMVKMMQQMRQMMGSVAGGGGGGGRGKADPNDTPQDLPPMLQAMMGAAAAGGKTEPSAAATSSACMWRMVHAVFAVALATYMCVSSTFTGSQLGRSPGVSAEGGAGHGSGARLFGVFATGEVVLQSARYFAEKGRLQGGGVLATVANSGFVPEPYANYVRVLGRYVTIARTIFGDVMVVVFVLGCMAWWQGMAIEA